MIFLELFSCSLAGWLLYEAAKEVTQSRLTLQRISTDTSVPDIAQTAIENDLPNLRIETIDPDAVAVDDPEELTLSNAIAILLNNRRHPTPNACYNNSNLKHPILELTAVEDNLDSALVVAGGLAQAERDRDGFNPRKGIVGRAILLTLLFTVPLWEYANTSPYWDGLQAICTIITVAHALLLCRDWWETQRDINTRSQRILRSSGITGLGEHPAVHTYFHAKRRQLQIEAIAIPTAIAVALIYHYV